MKAEIRSLDVCGDALAEYAPSDRSAFEVEVTAAIGPQGEEGTNYFMFTVRSMRSECEGEHLVKPVWLAHGELSLPTFDSDVIKESIATLVAAAEGDSWMDVIDLLRSKLRWEYD